MANLGTTATKFPYIRKFRNNGYILVKQLDDRQSERSVHSFAKRTIKYFNLSKFFDVTEYQTQSLITVIYTCLDWQFQHHKMLQVNQYGALQNLQNLSNIIVFQNYETFNNLAHGEFMEWYKNLGYNKNFVSLSSVLLKVFFFFGI